MVTVALARNASVPSAQLTTPAGGRIAGALRGRGADEGRARRQRVGEADAGRGVGTVVVDAYRVGENAAGGARIGAVRLVDDEVCLLRERGRPDRCKGGKGEGGGDSERARPQSAAMESWCAK